MIQIPVTKNGNSNFDITLDGVRFTLKYRFNNRNSRIYLSIFRGSEEVLAGLRLIEDMSVNWVYRTEDQPQGTFAVFQFKGDKSFATLGNLGINQPYSLIYYTEDEVER